MLQDVGLNARRLFPCMLPFHKYPVHQQRAKWSDLRVLPCRLRVAAGAETMGQFPASGIYFLIKDYQQPTAR